MLLPQVFVAVGIATFDHELYQKVYHCYCFFVFISLLADVIAKMADGVAMLVFGRCYCHVADVFATIFVVMLADIIARWLMECLPWVWMADVIAKVADGLATGSMF